MFNSDDIKKTIEESNAKYINKKLKEVFDFSLKQTISEIKKGANSDDFSDLVIINFIINSHKENLPIVDIKNFIKDLESNDFNNDDNINSEEDAEQPIIDLI